MAGEGEGVVLDLGTGDQGGGAGGEGGGGGDQGGGEGGGEFDNFGADGEAGGEGGEGGEGDGQGDGEGDRSRGGDQQYTDKQFRTDLAKLKEVDPALAKQYQRAFYKAQNVSKLGSIQDLTTFKETIELHGGVDGINQIIESNAAWDTVEQGLETGDPKVIEGWARDYPEGFKRLILPSIDRLGSMDPAYWESNVGAPVATQFLDKFGVFDAFGQLGEALRGQKPEDAIRIYNDLVSKVLKPMRDLAGKARATDPLNKDRENLNKEKTELLNEKQKLFYTGVRQDVNKIVTASINSELRKLIGGRRLSVQQGNRIRSEINSELMRVVNTDANYARQYKTVMGAADHDRAVKFITTRANSKVSLAVRAVLRDFNMLKAAGAGGGGGNGNGGGAGGNGQVRRVAPGASGTGGSGRAGATQVVNGKPKAGDVDFTRTEKSSWLLPKGQAWGKDGRLYKW